MSMNECVYGFKQVAFRWLSLENTFLKSKFERKTPQKKKKKRKFPLMATKFQHFVLSLTFFLYLANLRDVTPPAHPKTESQPQLKDEDDRNK